MARRLAAAGLGRSGGFTVEFALVVPLFAMTVMLLLELGTQIAVAGLLDSAARDASRFGITGATVPTGMEASPPKTRAEALRRIVLQRGAGLLIDGNLTIATTSFNSWGDMADPKKGTAGSQGSRSNVVIYELSYRQPFMTGFAGYVMGVKELVHTSRAVVLNEPFPTS